MKYERIFEVFMKFFKQFLKAVYLIRMNISNDRPQDNKFRVLHIYGFTHVRERTFYHFMHTDVDHKCFFFHILSSLVENDNIKLIK